MTAYYLDAHADRPVAHVGPPRGLHRVVVDVDDLVQVPRHVARDLRQLLEVEVPAHGLGHLNIALREVIMGPLTAAATISFPVPRESLASPCRADAKRRPFCGSIDVAALAKAEVRL